MKIVSRTGTIQKIKFSGSDPSELSGAGAAQLSVSPLVAFGVVFGVVIVT